jgi:hypothetical protein
MQEFQQSAAIRDGENTKLLTKSTPSVTEHIRLAKRPKTVTGLIRRQRSPSNVVTALQSSDPSSDISSRSGACALDLMVDRLVADLAPVASPPIARRLSVGLGAGLVLSLVLVGIIFGYRPDMATATMTTIFWVKLAYVAGIGAIALWAVERLVRPGVPTGNLLLWLLVPTLTMAGLAAIQLIDGPADLREHLIMGFSAAAAPWRILAAALPPLVGLAWAVRGLAPTRLVFAGAMVGLAAGGFGAASYAMHCQESAAPFLLIWYSAGVVACGFLGAALGPRMLRW